MTGSEGTKTPAVKNTPQNAISPQGDAPEQREDESRAAWMMGWVIGPGVVLGSIFGGGVLVGAHFHDSWISRLVMWTASLFS